VAKGHGVSRDAARQIGGLLRAPKALRASAWQALAKTVASAMARQVPGDPEDHIVHDYAFATVGDRDARGRFRLRGRFFRLPDEALGIYRRLDKAYLADLVRSLNLGR
jgi:hypothetical protein